MKINKKTIVCFLRTMSLLAFVSLNCSEIKAAENLLLNNMSDAKTVEVYVTSKNTENRMFFQGAVSFSNASQPLETEVSVFVNSSKTFQTFLGIGGAITDASAEVFAKLPKNKQQEFLNAYFGKGGIRYSLLRTSIASCDFSSESYSYIKDGDSALNTFSIEHDKHDSGACSQILTPFRAVLNIITENTPPTLFAERFQRAT